MGISPGPWPPNIGQTVERSAVSELLAEGLCYPRAGARRRPSAWLRTTPAGAASCSII
jgi:hypothetical protein